MPLKILTIRDIGKPVIAHNFAAAWNALSMAYVRQPTTGYGRLLTIF
jgi:maleate cis-trans isomerase